jgi:hypothetical protein
VDAAYPNLGAAGNPSVHLVHEFPAGGECPALRLYRVEGHPTGQ